MTTRHDSNHHGAYHRGRSHARREKLPPIPERTGRSPVRRRVPRLNESVEDRDDRSTAAAASVATGRTSVKSMERRLSTPSTPARRSLPILPAQLDECASTGEYGETTTSGMVSNQSTAIESSNGDVKNSSKIVQPEHLSDAITPSMRNISRKHISAVIGSSCDDNSRSNQSEAKVKNYAPEPTWMDFEQIALDEEPPELRSIPTDEIIDSCVESSAADESSDIDNNHPREMMESTLARETRDQYQLERLQTRINHRREIMQSMIVQKEHGGPSYKTMRSSRIKSVRNLYNPNPSTIIRRQDSSSHDSIANGTKSTIPSLKHGHKVSPSMASSVSPLRSSLCDTELSEYRGKAFAEMMQLLMNDPTLDKDSLLESISNLDDKAMVNNLVELEMSRILHDFEQNNSLIETRCTAASDAKAPKSGAISVTSVEHTPTVVEDYVVPPPEKISFNENGSCMSIVSKVSDVTSPTVHDGFELDEIIPTPSARLPRWETKSLSPAAAAAASVAASMISASGGGKKQYGDALPSVLEFPEQFSLEEDKDHESTTEVGAFDVIESPKDSDEPTTSSKLMETTMDHGDARKAAEDSSSSRRTGNRIADEVDFHYRILRTVANDDDELKEVLSILSKYEEAEMKPSQQTKEIVPSPFDESGSSKQVAFTEPLKEDPACGCFIQ